MSKKYYKIFKQTNKDDTDLRALKDIFKNVEITQDEIIQDIVYDTVQKEFDTDKYNRILEHIDFQELNFIRMDTIEALIKKESFIKNIFDELQDRNIDNIYFRVSEKQGLYITINQCYEYKNIYNLFIFRLSEYLDNMGLKPKKYKKSEKTISQAFIENIRSKFTCEYQTDINRNIIITKLHLFTAGHDEKYFNKLKRNSKYQNYTTNKQGKKKTCYNGIYSKETQRQQRNISKECVYCYDTDNKIYKHEYRLGTHEIKVEFQGMKFTNMFDIDKILEHLKTEKQNGNQNKGIVMKLKENDVKKELYKAVDLQKELSKEIKDEIKRQIDKRLKPIYEILYKHEKEIQENRIMIKALEKRTDNIENNLELSNRDKKYYNSGIFS